MCGELRVLQPGSCAKQKTSFNIVNTEGKPLDGPLAGGASNCCPVRYDEQVYCVELIVVVSTV